MPIKPATKSEIESLIKILMDPNDERDLAAVRKLNLPEETFVYSPTIIQKTPKKSELVKKILQKSKAIRENCFPELEQEKQQNPNYNKLLMDRANTRANQYILEIHSHNARIIKEKTADCDTMGKYQQLVKDPAKNRARSHSI
jgi:hypothetical protein